MRLLPAQRQGQEGVAGGAPPLPFPERIPVKISSEAAGSVSFTPVVRQDVTPAELLQYVLPVTGKNLARVREVLRQGTVVRGASRFRWTPLEAAPEELAEALAAFPDSRPDRPFDPQRCVRARLSGGRAPIDLESQAASRKRWFKSRSFWQALMETTSGLPLAYQQYSYADQADVYQADLSANAAQEIRAQAGLLPYSALETAVREYGYSRLETWVQR